MKIIKNFFSFGTSSTQEAIFGGDTILSFDSSDVLDKHARKTNYNSRINLYLQFSRICFSLVLVLGVIGALGWVMDIPLFKTLLPSLASMKSNTTLCIMLLGLTGMISSGMVSFPNSQSVHGLFTAFVTILAFVTLLQYWLGFNAGIDEMFFRDAQTSPENYPGRMSPGTAFCCMLGSISLESARFRFYKLQQWLALMLIFFALVAALGYMFDVNALYRFFFYSTMALHTAYSFVLLGVALFLCHLNRGPFRVLASDSMGGFLCRKLLPVAFLLPICLSGLVIWGESVLDYEEHFGLFIFTILTLFLLVAAIVSAAYSLHSLDIRYRRLQRRNLWLQDKFAGIQRLESMGLLAAGISHDFNNLLQPILMLTEESTTKLSREHRAFEDFQIIHEAARRASTLASKILAFGRKQDLETRSIDLNQVVEEFTPILQKLVIMKGVLTVRFHDEPLLIYGDKNQIEQVLMNLVVNAGDAIEDGGQISIILGTTELDESYTERYLENISPGIYASISVNDTGQGMDSKTRKRIFEPFYSTKHKSIGTGLGLSTAHGIIKQHLGGISVYSEPGEGTSFKVFLPLHGMSENSTLSTTAGFDIDDNLLADTSILIVEDEGIIREMLVKVLIKSGATLMLAESISGCMDVLRESARKPDILLADVYLPDGFGKSLYDQLNSTHPGLKVLYMSGYRKEALTTQGLIDDEDDFLYKPFMMKELVQRIAELMGKSDAGIRTTGVKPVV